LTNQDEILLAVAIERNNQDQQWGGPEHDDKYSSLDFTAYIGRQVHKMYGDPASDRDRFIKIAALAVAAIESIDRKSA
jgi:hypothetical protein